MEGQATSDEELLVWEKQGMLPRRFGRVEHDRRELKSNSP